MEKDKQLRVILVGGGTGGHIFPLIAIGEELESRKIPFVYVGGEHGREKEIVASYGWSFETIQAGKWRRYFSLSSLLLNLTDSFRVVVGFFQSLVILYRTQATVVISKGGYVALPFVYATRFSKTKLIIHESDALMGLTNKLSSRFADKVLTAFETDVYPDSDQRYLQVGVPIRKSLRMAAKLKGPAKTRPVILVMPGIQGSQAVNNYLKPIIKKLVNHYDLIHSTGEKDFVFFQQLQAGLEKNEQSHYKPYAFIDRELPYYFQSADLVIGRASITTIAEGAMFGKAMYLIPLPTAAGNHQVINARLLTKAEAVMAKEQYQLSPDILFDDITKLLSQPERLNSLGRKLRRYFQEDATLELIIKEITN